MLLPVKHQSCKHCTCQNLWQVRTSGCPLRHWLINAMPRIDCHTEHLHAGLASGTLLRNPHSSVSRDQLVLAPSVTTGEEGCSGEQRMHHHRWCCSAAHTMQWLLHSTRCMTNEHKSFVLTHRVVPKTPGSWQKLTKKTNEDMPILHAEASFISAKKGLRRGSLSLCVSQMSHLVLFHSELTICICKQLKRHVAFSTVHSSTQGAVCFACLWNQGLCLHDEKLLNGSLLSQNCHSFFGTQCTVFGSKCFCYTDWVALCSMLFVHGFAMQSEKQNSPTIVLCGSHHLLQHALLVRVRQLCLWFNWMQHSHQFSLNPSNNSGESVLHGNDTHAEQEMEENVVSHVIAQRGQAFKLLLLMTFMGKRKRSMSDSVPVWIPRIAGLAEQH